MECLFALDVVYFNITKGLLHLSSSRVLNIAIVANSPHRQLIPIVTELLLPSWMLVFKENGIARVVELLHNQTLCYPNVAQIRLVGNVGLSSCYI